MKSAKPPAPLLVINPDWGYACVCPICDERLQNDRDMRTSEQMYQRHWRDRHRGEGLMTRAEELRLIEEAVEAGRVERLATAHPERLVEIWLEGRADRKTAGIKRYWNQAKAKQRKRSRG